MGREIDLGKVIDGISRARLHFKPGDIARVYSAMAGHATSNPLPSLWTYTAGFSLRAQAAAVESALLHHLSADKVHGEWVHVRGLSESAAAAVAESLAEVASATRGEVVQFSRGIV